MTVEQLADVVMNELAWCNFFTMVVVAACIIAVATLGYKLHKQNLIIHSMEQELRYIQRYLK